MRIIAYVVLGLALQNGVAFAQERGRLDDGRAYRVDQGGFRLVDEIAELQVSNDDLRQQVARLESALDKRESELNACTGLKPTAAHESPTPQCDELVSSLYLRISRLEKGQSGESLPPAAGTAAANASMQAEITRLSEELVQRNEEIAAKEREIAVKEREIEQMSEESPQTVAAACDYESPENPYRERLAALESSSRARLSAVSTAAPAPVVVRDASSDVEILRSQLEAKLAEINSLIGSRKSYYDKVREQKGMKSLNLRRLETARGMSLDSIRRQVNRLNNPSQVAPLNSAIQEIESLLRQDIQTLKRFLG